MTAHCDPLCPFVACPSCAFTGAETVAAQADSARDTARNGVICGTIEAAPGGASTPLLQGPRPSGTSGGLTHMMAQLDQHAQPHDGSAG